MTTRLLDLCCGAGLGADGYHHHGLSIVGIDVAPQPHYPYDFMQADALFALDGGLSSLSVSSFDAIHASFPCQAHTRAKHLRTAQGGTSRFDDVLTPGLELLRREWGHKPWIVENVPGAPMEPQAGEHLTRLCGSMFGL
jgi:DNA (cytosine-5)-methyltransferase 1